MTAAATAGQLAASAIDTAPRRSASLSDVLRLVHQRGPLTRSRIAAELGLSRSAVRMLVAELCGYGLVAERSGEPLGTAGRPSLIVEVAQSAVASLAIQIRSDALCAAEAGLGGRLGPVKQISRGPRRFRPAETVEDITGLAVPILHELAARKVHLTGIGVAFGGLVRMRDGFVFASPALGWRDVPLASLIAARLGVAGQVAVFVGNDGDLGALAEHLLGTEDQGRTFLYVSADIGVGGGIVIDGRPLLPSRSSAAEIGHIAVNPEGHRCRCGNRGCWESEISADALLRQANRKPVPDQATAIDELIADASGGNPPAVAAIREHARWVGIGLASIANILAPDLISLGGLLARLFPLESEVMNTEVSRRVQPPLQARLTVRASALGANAPLVGAGTLALEPVLAAPHTYTP
jgi:predicted NBD/HSP70 family sugar kinase